MRIAQIATVSAPVRATNSGSIECLVWLLTRELIQLGHEVTVFAAAGSETHGELVATLPGPYGSDGAPDDWQLCEWINLCRAVEESARFDVLHSHAYLWGMPLQCLSRAPLVHTYHIWPHENEARLWSMAPDACVTALSDYQWCDFPELRPAATIYHGVDPAQFTFRAEPDDYVCYLGRFTWGKGPTVAIGAARALGLRLLLAGPCDDYYREHVAPLVDGRAVEYVGEVGIAERDKLLGGAHALLYPVQYPEPFGLVLAEAMMCGTPAAAINLGAVAEVVDEGVTGCCAPSAEEFPRAVLDSLSLDRRQVRARAEARFSAQRMALEYAQVYHRLVAGIRG
jgi:glycosyltransferase involved in cell wall biosynthesis